jgi:hypothetical protein
LQRGANHAAGKLTHRREIHRHLNLFVLEHLLGAARDSHGLIANALEVAVDLDDSKDEAQIDGHGLLLGEQFIGHLVKIALRGVDGSLILLDVLAEAPVALQVSVYRGLNRLLREGSHGQELVLEFGELLVKVDARQYSSPTIDCASCNVTSRRISAHAPET